jgi:MFS family permease
MSGHRRLLAAFAIDALGTGLYLPFSLLFFTVTTDLRLPQVGLALSAAAVVRIPATAVAGVLTDRFGGRAVIVASNLLQALGFLGYLFVGSFPQLLLAAVVVQIGNSWFWVAQPAVVHDVADVGRQESWFALITALRNAGLALGGLGAGLAVAVGGTGGYRGIVIVNCVSFLVAAGLLARRRTGAAATRPPVRDGHRPWGVLRDGPFLAFVGLNVGFVLLSLAFVVGVPVFLVRSAALPDWLPGVVLSLNAVLGAAGATAVVALIAGRRRRDVLVVSQLIMAAGYACVLATAYTSWAFVTIFAGAVLITLTELIQGPTVAAIVNDAGTTADRGRYISIYQMTFSVVDIICPTLLTALLARGPIATWVPLILLAAGNALILPVLSRRIPLLRGRVGGLSRRT